ncbi:MAG: GIY-YIG nuclease family protein [Verrucomicrobiae bacterium]|nr:GIY-YIG nuclease family protein [Verrucomicrobiae bacterium]
MYFLYILRTSDNRLYIGISRDLDQRLETHDKGKGALFTKVHGTGTLVYSEEFRDYASARQREVQLKKWSRAKKEALISSDLFLLKELSKAHLSCRRS